MSIRTWWNKYIHIQVNIIEVVSIFFEVIMVEKEIV